MSSSLKATLYSFHSYSNNTRCYYIARQTDAVCIIVCDARALFIQVILHYCKNLSDPNTLTNHQNNCRGHFSNIKMLLLLIAIQ